MYFIPTYLGENNKILVTAPTLRENKLATL